ncbi:putative Carbon storage regulator CsrA [Thiomonas sp. X19]|uniref:carbon storage regulator CsrA n=1 Tax=Thiomonas sp. X19 TaxID=1050370 RepID=UPI000B73AF95|nr:carbon storage regulator CsrA [Thiomonas sp. X19]SCC91088.1 putative Carbon storage regulator CsrA [Thiomonas sp. X19]
MLILSRHAGEAIRIGQDVRIVVVHVGGGKVRLGIEGPKQLRILREELYTLVSDLNQQAQAPDQGTLDAWLEGTKTPR